MTDLRRGCVPAVCGPGRTASRSAHRDAVTTSSQRAACSPVWPVQRVLTLMRAPPSEFATLPVGFLGRPVASRAPPARVRSASSSWPRRPMGSYALASKATGTSTSCANAPPAAWQPGRTRSTARRHRGAAALLRRRLTRFASPIDWSVLSPPLAEGLQAVRRVPYGRRRSYVDLASPVAPHELGWNLGADPIPIPMSPHHPRHRAPRIFAGGPERRRWLDTHERHHVPRTR